MLGTNVIEMNKTDMVFVHVKLTIKWGRCEIKTDNVRVLWEYVGGAGFFKNVGQYLSILSCGLPCVLYTYIHVALSFRIRVLEFFCLGLNPCSLVYLLCDLGQDS